MPKTIGIPRTLAYYTFFPLWKIFLEELGLNVVLSRQTNKAILEMGVRDAVNDACLPIKIYHGHVADLKDRADYLFVPRMISADGRSTFCPKFLGLPDMVRFSATDLPPLLDLDYRMRRGRFSNFLFLKTLGEQLGYSLRQVSRAYLQARRVFQAYREWQYAGLPPEEAMREAESSGRPRLPSRVVKYHAGLKIAVLGYPYAVYDPFINANLLQILKEAGCEVWTVERVSDSDLRKMSRELKEDLYWYYSNRVVWAGLHYLSQTDSLDGLIHVTAFACGPDAMVDKLLELESRDRGQVPFLKITIDEHSGDAGLVTRLEAFLDMLKARQRPGLTPRV